MGSSWWQSEGEKRVGEVCVSLVGVEGDDFLITPKTFQKMSWLVFWPLKKDLEKKGTYDLMP